MKKLFAMPIRSLICKFSACLLAFSIINLPLWAISGGSLFQGDANVSNSLVQLLSGNRAVINWDDFNTINGQTIEFRGVNMTDPFAVLNRVIAGGKTQFHGNLIGNQGHILLINPQGIVFGPTANISAARFTASTMHLVDDATFSNFMSGSDVFEFRKTSDDLGAQIALLAGSQINAQRVELLAQQIINAGAITTGSGTSDIIVMATGDNILLAEPGSDFIIEVNLSDSPAAQPYNVINDVSGSIQSPNGTIVMAAGDTFSQALEKVQTNSYTANTYTASQRGTLNASTLEMGAANQADIRTASSTVANKIKIAAKKILLEESVESNGKIIMDSDFDINALKSLKSGDTIELKAKTVQVREDITAGSTATVDADVLYSRGDVISEDDLLIMAESVLWGDTDQTIRSETSVKSTESISKVTSGNIYISATGNVQLNGDVSAIEGGISIISENGKIHTGDSDILNVAISGYSDEITNSIGVELPDGEGKAAIVLKSSDTLNLGSDAYLKADGIYLSANDDPVNGVDNRPDITWLDTDNTEIGGYKRDEGVVSDVAIYIGSENGNVNVETAHIETAQPNGQSDIDSGPATVVFDAQDTVTMPSLETVLRERIEQENSNLFRFRLEVATRITEWLYQAVQGAKLPYAGNPEAVEAVTGEDYVLRGAGLGNPQITDGRIWVLENLEPPEDQPSPQPTLAPVAPLAEQQLPEFVGCPTEMEAAALELEINSDTLQLKIQDSMATNPNLQPCDACANLLVAAGALQDRDGYRYSALTEIFNTLAPLDAPFTPEMAIIINNAFSKLADEDPKYALADDFINSFVTYIAVLEEDLKTPVGDALVFTLNKYGEAIMSNPNQNIISYLVEKVQERRNVQYVAQMETEI